MLDADEMEAPLVRELLEMKHEIIRQMEITDRLTNQAKGNRKSYLEVENNNIIKQRKLKEERKQQDQNLGLKLDDVKTEDSALEGDNDVVNEVTVTSEDAPHDDDDHSDAVEDDVKKIKNNTTNKNKKKIEESKLAFLYLCCISMLQMRHIRVSSKLYIAFYYILSCDPVPLHLLFTTVTRLYLSLN